MEVTTGGSGDNLGNNGLISGHAYCLLGAHDVILDDGSSVRLIKIRNPWGKGEWKGAWNDEDKIWDDNPTLFHKL